MTNSESQGAKLMGVKEVAQITGLPPSTIRYYDQQFSEYLGVQRGSGRRRLFDQPSLERLLAVHRMLKQDGLSLRQARQALSKGAAPAATPPTQDWGREELERLGREVESLKQQLSELREIQKRTLALVDGLTRS